MALANRPLQYAQLRRDFYAALVIRLTTAQADLSRYVSQFPSFGIASVGSGCTRDVAAPAYGAAQISSEEGFQCRGFGADDGQIALDGCPEPECVPDPSLVVGFTSGTLYVNCTNNACNTDPGEVSW